MQHVLRSDDGRVVGVHHNTAKRNGRQLDVYCRIASSSRTAGSLMVGGTFTTFTLGTNPGHNLSRGAADGRIQVHSRFDPTTGWRERKGLHRRLSRRRRVHPDYRVAARAAVSTWPELQKANAPYLGDAQAGPLARTPQLVDPKGYLQFAVAKRRAFQDEVNAEMKVTVGQSAELRLSAQGSGIASKWTTGRCLNQKCHLTSARA